MKGLDLRNGWYLNIVKLDPKSRFVGYRHDILEYAFYHWFGFYFFVIYLNNWRDDA